MDRVLKRIITITILILIPTFTRVALYKLGLAINVEAVTACTLLAGTYLGFPANILVPLLSMAFSDAIIGNTAIFIFTWSAYGIIGLGSLILRKFKKDPRRLIIASIFSSLGTSLFFYLWTNFGVWYQGWYPPTLQGLITCYIMGLPFLKYNIIGNLIIVPLAFSLVSLVVDPLLLRKEAEVRVPVK